MSKFVNPDKSKHGFKPRTRPGSVPIPKQKLRGPIVPHSGNSNFVSPPHKLKKKVMTTKKESVFHRYTVPKRKKPSFVDPACSPPSAKRSTIVVPRVTSVRDKTWRLRNYDGVQCMVITLSAAEKQVTVRTSDMAKGMKIPSAGDSHIRDWTRVSVTGQ